MGTQYWVGNHGFAGVNFEGTIGEDGPYAGTTTASTMFDYTWAGDGFSITAGVQNTGGIAGNINAGNSHDYYAGFNYSASWGGVAFTALHDSSAVDAVSGDIGGWAYKVSADLNLSEWIPGGILHGMYMTDGDYLTNYVAWGPYFTNAADIWQVSFQMNLTEEFQFVAQYSGIEGQAANQDGWAAGLGLTWYPVAAPGLKVYAGYAFGEANGANVVAAAPPALTPTQVARNAVINNAINTVDYDAFTIVVRRDF